MNSSVWVVNLSSSNKTKVFKNKSLALSWLKFIGLKKDGNFFVWKK